MHGCRAVRVRLCGEVVETDAPSGVLRQVPIRVVQRDRPESIDRNACGDVEVVFANRQMRLDVQVESCCVGQAPPAAAQAIRCRTGSTSERDPNACSKPESPRASSIRAPQVAANVAWSYDGGANGRDDSADSLTWSWSAFAAATSSGLEGSASTLTATMRYSVSNRSVVSS
jgi:hypothetical protein